MKYTRESVIDRYNAGEELHIIAFWGHTPNPNKMTKACFSQWYDCQFVGKRSLPVNFCVLINHLL